METADPREPLSATLDALPEPTMLVGTSGLIEMANRRAEDLFGCPRQELEGRAFDGLVAESDRVQAAAALRLRRGVVELRMTRKDGTDLQLQMCVGAVELQSGGPSPCVLVLRPGLALTQALVKLLSSAPDAIVIVRRDGHIVLTNDRVEALFGYRPEELLGRTVEVLLPARLAERHVALRDAYCRDPDVRLAHGRTGDIIGRKKDGTEFPADIMLSPVNAEAGLLVVASIRDATERRNLEEARLGLVRREEALRLRDDFLDLVAHELRTPLTPLRLQVDRLLRGAREGKAIDPQAARQLDDAVRRTEQVVEELLETSRLVSGELTLAREEVDLCEVVRDEVERARKNAQSAGGRIVLSGCTSLRGTWDPKGVRQVVAELLSNAIKFDGGAPIEVTVEAEAGTAVVKVHDRGIGVVPENRGALFERFARFVSSRQYAGLGIGLWLAKQIVVAHGGTIDVSGEAEGATFRVELPIR